MERRRRFLTLGVALLSGVTLYKKNEIVDFYSGLPYYYDFEDKDPDKAHLSANIFAKNVGDKLKKYDLRVTKIEVKINYVNGKYVYKWNAYFRKPNKGENPHKHFDRRGTMLSGPTLTMAKNKVEKEIEGTKKVQKMIDLFKSMYRKKGKVYNNYITESHCLGPNGEIWFVREYGCVDE